MYGKQGAFLKSDGRLTGRTARVAEEGLGEAVVRVGQLSPYPPHRADLELMLDRAFVYMFFFFSLPGAVYTVRLRPHGGTFGVTDVRRLTKRQRARAEAPF